MARDYGGTNEHDHVTNTVYELGSDMSLSAWINYDLLSSGSYKNCMVSCNQNGSSEYFYFFTLESTGKLRYSDKTNDELASVAGSIAATTWIHVGFTRDISGTSLRFFMSGAELGTAQTISAISAPTSGAVLAIGTDSKNAATYPFNGRIAEVGIWNRVLSPDEMYELGKGIAPGARPRGLVAWFPLVGGSLLDRKQGLTLTTSSSTASQEHPPVHYPRQPFAGKWTTAADPAGVRVLAMASMQLLLRAG